MKKRFTIILGACIFSLALITGGIAAEAGYSSQKNISTDNNHKTNTAKDNLYYDYITNTLESAIKNNDEIQDCEININHSNNTLISVNVKIVTKDNELNTMDTDIKDYISQALEILPENITLTK